MSAPALTNESPATLRTAFRLLAFAAGGFGIALQYWLVAEQESGLSLAERTVNFFSYFTILMNILAAAAMLFPTVAPNSTLGRYFAQVGVRTALAAYMIIGAAVYALILRHLWDPQGWHWVADTLLHYVTPALFVIDWLFFVARGAVRWKVAILSLAFPIVYVIWTLIRGSIVNWYPYPFVDAATLGYGPAFLNIAGLFAVFLAVTSILIASDRLVARSTSGEPSARG
jgi:hypothetical protein